MQMSWFDEDDLEYIVKFDYTPADQTPITCTTISPPDPAIVEIISIKDVIGLNEIDEADLPIDEIVDLCYEYGAENWDEVPDPEYDDDDWEEYGY